MLVLTLPGDGIGTAEVGAILTHLRDSAHEAATWAEVVDNARLVRYDVATGFLSVWYGGRSVQVWDTRAGGLANEIIYDQEPTAGEVVRDTVPA